MKQTQSIWGTVLIVLALILGGWVVWRSLAPAAASATTTLVPLELTADQLPSATGLAILKTVRDDPAAQFELPVPRPDQASTGKQNLFQ